jgi:opacity protein-like surface antigen
MGEPRRDREGSMTGASQRLIAAAFGIAMFIAHNGLAAAQDVQGLSGARSASVTYGPYARAEAGWNIAEPSDGSWTPPGSADPRITFDVDGETGGFGAIAVGYDWQNGVRADLSVFGIGASDVSASCARASDGTSCSTHVQSVNAEVSTRGLMANIFYAPLEARGSNSLFQPFLVAGLGIARNEVSDWTRTNPGSARPSRTFEGDTSSDLAWSIGAGASLQVSRPGRWPIILEAAWRYYDFGTASGGSTPLPDSGGSEPREPFSFDHESHVVTFGIRVPLQKY